MLQCENFLHFIWQFQHFDRQNLQTNDYKNLEIIKTGQVNTNAGPDFLEAHILINGIFWAGQIEIHWKASDWLKHQHQNDIGYESVILHVVWDANAPVCYPNGSLIPTFELKNRVDPAIFNAYQDLIKQPSPIPCHKSLHLVSPLIKWNAIEKALVSRLEAKVLELEERFFSLSNDYDAISYQVFMSNLGFKLNAHPFEQLAAAAPWSVIRKVQSSISHTEALLFGLAGFLSNPQDEYSQSLSLNYNFLSEKFNLKNKEMNRNDWKFMRTRPSNFPTMRIAQAAAILSTGVSLFQYVTESSEDLLRLLRTKPSEYWTTHYDFNKPSSEKSAILGDASIENIMINTVVRLLVFYSKKTGNDVYFEQALEILEKLRPEKNHITKLWSNLGFDIKNAYETQGIYHQHYNMCELKKCISCGIGSAILKSSKTY